ncbi:MAG: zinc ribbon domain-containing protein [Pedosphaera sp.]|nr:zinc ribbon domain-containing protein [Pedosphaera sp.]MSU43351.1 zinc ribbon domain-containing protein [Pedosphaera sp.]
MPIYEYELCEGKCVVCGGCFELRRPLAAPPLKACPVCKKDVRKVFSGRIYMPKHLKKVNVRAAKEAGFTVLKRTSKGEYEVHKPSRGVE